jgi:hypothetical protein
MNTCRLRTARRETNSSAPIGFPSARASGWRVPDSLPAPTRQSSAAVRTLTTTADGDNHATARLHMSKYAERLVAFTCNLSIGNSDRRSVGAIAGSAVGDDRDTPDAIKARSRKGGGARRENDHGGQKASDQSPLWGFCHGLLRLLRNPSRAQLDDVDPGSSWLRKAAWFLACSKPMSNSAFIR